MPHRYILYCCYIYLRINQDLYFSVGQVLPRAPSVAIKTRSDGSKISIAENIQLFGHFHLMQKLIIIRINFRHNKLAIFNFLPLIQTTIHIKLINNKFWIFINVDAFEDCVRSG